MDVKDVFLLLASQVEFHSGRHLIKKLYSSFGDFLNLFNEDFNNFNSILTYTEVERFKQIREALRKESLDKIKRKLDVKGIGFIAFLDKEYPEKLKEIIDSPFGIFYKGNINLLNDVKVVAIVGTRSATNYGLKVSEKIASMLAENNVVVISGLASGIDTSAHIGAVKNGKTIAVLGTGVDIVFPASNNDLYDEILDKGGLIISEYPLGTEGLPWNFPQRNRIISALSNAVVIVEGDLQSGAMITARFAIKQGKPLFALPGSIDSPQSNGPNILIKSGVGELLTSVNDILEKIGEGKQINLNLNNSREEGNGLTEKQKNIYKYINSHSKSFDNLLKESKLTTQELLCELSILELKGFIEKTTDGGYVSLS